jgi:arylsulfatase A-like enzyme
MATMWTSIIRLAMALGVVSLGISTAVAFQADTTLTGAWFDPTHDGEGFLVEALDDGQAVVYWFTYDDSGNQRWFIGTGTLSGDSAGFDQLLSASGPSFGDAYDTEDVRLEVVGQLTITWSDCDSATAEYTVDGVTGIQVLSRLSSVAGLECSGPRSALSNWTGSWFDYSHDGEGLVVEALTDGRIMIFWFSYGPDGAPAWFFGLGEADGEMLTLGEMQVTSGGVFGAEYDPSAVRLDRWGEAVVELHCGYGKLDFNAESASFGNGKQTLSRLTAPGGSVCSDPPPPNLLLIIADDLGLDASNAYGIASQTPYTPNLDQLAADGLVFDNAWANSTCSPTRAGILTGRFGRSTGVMEPGDILASTETSLQAFIRERRPGLYSDAVIGKWHLGPQRGNPDHPAELGISHFSGIIGGGVGDYQQWTLTTDGVQAQETRYSTSKLVDLAEDWIGAQAQSWFLWLAFNAPHTPFHLPPAELHDRNLPDDEQEIAANPLPYYLAAIEAMDSEIGRLLDSMDPATRANTLIVFLGDNGSPGQVAQEPVGRRKAKGTLYRGGIQVPLFVSGSGVERAGERESALVTTTDLFATLAELARINVSTVNDSVSFTGLLAGAREEERWYQYSDQSWEGVESWAVSDGDYKLIETGQGEQELYDLIADPWEDNELIGTEQAPPDTLDILESLADLVREQP